MTDYLDEIQARADAATDGPWYAEHHRSGVNEIRRGRPAGPVALRVIGPAADAEFIAHARTDVPRLVAEQRDLIRLLDAAREDKIKARRQRSEYRLRAMRAEAAIRAVEALHTRVGSEDQNGFCVACCDMEPLWPCPTVTAIRDALDPT